MVLAFGAIQSLVIAAATLSHTVLVGAAGVVVVVAILLVFVMVLRGNGSSHRQPGSGLGYDAQEGPLGQSQMPAADGPWGAPEDRYDSMGQQQGQGYPQDYGQGYDQGFDQGFGQGRAPSSAQGQPAWGAPPAANAWDEPAPAGPAGGGWGAPPAQAPSQPAWGAPAANAWDEPAPAGTGAGWGAPQGQQAPSQPAWGAPAAQAPSQPAWGAPPAQAPSQPAWGAPAAPASGGVGSSGLGWNDQVAPNNPSGYPNNPNMPNVPGAPWGDQGQFNSGLGAPQGQQAAQPAWGAPPAQAPSQPAWGAPAAQAPSQPAWGAPAQPAQAPSQPAAARAAAPGTAVFVERAGKAVGTEYPLAKDRITIGRHRDSDIFLEDLSVSRLHTTVTRDPSGQLILRDENSANGSYVNGQRVSEHALREGDEVQIGATVLIFQRR